MSPGGPAGSGTGPQATPGPRTGPQATQGPRTGPQATPGPRTGPQATQGPRTGPQATAEPGTAPQRVVLSGTAPLPTLGRTPVRGFPPVAPGPSGREQPQPAQDSYGPWHTPGTPVAVEDDRWYADENGDGQPPAERVPPTSTAPASGRRAAKTAAAGAKRRPSRVALLATAGVLLLAIAGAAGYKYLYEPRVNAPVSPSLRLPTTAPGSPGFDRTLGKWQHIGTRAQDPKPLTIQELYPAQFALDGSSYVRTAASATTNCLEAVFGSQLQAALQAGHCTQVVRASYISGSGTMMGTVGVINLKTSGEAEKAGQVTGPDEIIAPLSAQKGPTSKLGNGTGVVQAEIKGHYLILIWAEFANLKSPSTEAQKQQLEQFATALVTGSANIDLSTRMLTGKAGTTPLSRLGPGGAQPAGLRGPRGQRPVRRVADLLQAQPVRRRDPHRGIAHRGREHGGGPAGRPSPLPHGEQRADQGADHVVAERVGDHRRDRDAVIVTVPLQAVQGPDGGRTRPAAAEGGEIVLAQAGKRRLVHGGDVQPPEGPQRLVPAQRVRGGRVIADAVGVAAPQRGEARVEPVGSRAHAVHPHIRREHRGQPGQRPVFRRRPGRRGHVRVNDLAARVHPGVRAPGDRQASRPGQPQHPAERRRHHVLDGAPAGLGCPPGKP
jgi:hypothetical protein